MKIDRFLCPFVGCYFVSAPKTDSSHAVNDARRAVEVHRQLKHHHDKTLTAYTEGKTWEHES